MRKVGEDRAWGWSWGCGYLGGGKFEVPLRQPRKGSHVGSQIVTAGAWGLWVMNKLRVWRWMGISRGTASVKKVCVCGRGEGAFSPMHWEFMLWPAPTLFSPNITVRVPPTKKDKPSHQTKSPKLMKTVLKRQPLNINDKWIHLKWKLYSESEFKITV